jgi:hypothetical protein
VKGGSSAEIADLQISRFAQFTRIEMMCCRGAQPADGGGVRSPITIAAAALTAAIAVAL